MRARVLESMHANAVLFTPMFVLTKENAKSRKKTYLTGVEASAVYALTV